MGSTELRRSLTEFGDPAKRIPALIGEDDEQDPLNCGRHSTRSLVTIEVAAAAVT
jgi:hypothetical protein